MIKRECFNKANQDILAICIHILTKYRLACLLCHIYSIWPITEISPLLQNALCQPEVRLIWVGISCKPWAVCQAHRSERLHSHSCETDSIRLLRVSLLLEIKSVATAVCSQARKSDSVRNSNCKGGLCPVWQKTKCPLLLKFSILWCHKRFWYHVTHWSLKLTPFASLACSAWGEIWYKPFQCLHTSIQPSIQRVGGSQQVIIS